MLVRPAPRLHWVIRTLEFTTPHYCREWQNSCGVIVHTGSMSLKKKNLAHRSWRTPSWSVFTQSWTPGVLRFTSAAEKSPRRRKLKNTGSTSDCSRCCNGSSFPPAFLTFSEPLEVFLLHGTELFGILAVYHSSWRMLESQGNLMKLPYPCLMFVPYRCCDQTWSSHGHVPNTTGDKKCKSDGQKSCPLLLPSQSQGLEKYKKAASLACWVMSVSHSAQSETLMTLTCKIEHLQNSSDSTVSFCLVLKGLV